MDWGSFIRPELSSLVPYSPGLRASEVRDRSGSKNILKLSSNEHPCGPVPSAVDAMRQEVARANRYPDSSSRSLRTRLCDHMDIEDCDLVIGNGSNELLRLIGQVVLRPGDRVVYAWPSFVVYPMVAKMFGAEAVQVPLKDDVHDLEAMLTAIDERTRIVFLCNPNNPTGTIYGRDDFASFMEQVPDHVLVVVDEAYIEFVTDPSCPDAMRWFDGERPLAVLRTFSKVYSLAGLRIGYGALPRALIEAVHKIREPFNVNVVAQVGAYFSLEDQDEVTRRRIENARMRTELADLFDELGITHVPSEANFVYIKTDRARGLFDALLTEGVIVRDFGDTPCLRVGIGTPEDMVVLHGAFRAAWGSIS